MSAWNDLRRLASGAAMVAREAARRSGPVEAAALGDVAGALKAVVLSATDLVGLTSGTVRRVSPPVQKESSSVVYFKEDEESPPPRSEEPVQRENFTDKSFQTASESTLEIVRQGADVMPRKRKQLNSVLDAELGTRWYFKLKSFDYEPLAAASTDQIYIVYLGEKKHDDPNVVTASHYEMLTPLFESWCNTIVPFKDAWDRNWDQRCPDMLRKEEAVKSILYSYKHGFSGFAAKLNESQAKILSGMPDVISVEPNRKYTIHMTHSWDFSKLSSEPRANTFSRGNMEKINRLRLHLS